MTKQIKASPASPQTKRGIVAIAASLGLIVMAGCSTAGAAGSAAGTTSSAPAGGILAKLSTSPYAVPSNAIIQAAKQEKGTLVWYESSPPALINPVLQAFEKQYPFIHVNHVELQGPDVATRVLQESAAGHSTADLATTGTGTFQSLTSENLLKVVNWTAAGIPKQLQVSNTEVLAAGTPYPIAYNPNVLTPSEVPTSWSDLLSPKFANHQICLWSHNTILANFIPVWGVAKTVAFAKKLAAQDPTLDPQGHCGALVGAGTVKIGLGTAEDAEQDQLTGAPIKLKFLNPTPLDLLSNAIPAKAAHPAMAELLAAWLASKTGSTLYENSVQKGNPLLPGTKIHKQLSGLQMSAFSVSPAALADYLKWTAYFTDEFEK